MCVPIALVDYNRGRKLLDRLVALYEQKFLSIRGATYKI